jgi:hypothetical protein
VKVGDLVRETRGFYGIVTAVSLRPQNDGAILVYVRFPRTGYGNWHHPTRLEVVSEA